MTLHKIIITHKTFHNYKKILFKHFKHMMQSKPTPLLCRHLINYCANTRGVTVMIVDLESMVAHASMQLTLDRKMD